MTFRSVITGEFAEGSFYLLDVGKHMPFDHHFGVSRNQEICSQSFRWCESEWRSHDGADFGVIIHAKGRDVQRSQIKCRMVADDDSDGRGAVFLFVLAMDLPVVTRRHVQAEFPWAFDHVALEGDIIKA